MDVRGLVSMFMSFVAFATSQEAFKAVGNAVSKEVVAIKNPVVAAIAEVGSSQCASVKKLFGVSYEQLQGEREPDLNQLTLVYKTREFSRIYNITTAAEELVAARDGHIPHKLVVYAHGFTDDPTKTSFTNVSDALLQTEDGRNITVMALDGSSLIRWLYLRSTTYVTFIGQKLAGVIQALVRKGVDPSNVHLVGHSLGAHICGNAGKRFYVLTGSKLGRITGLDPAGPCYTEVDPNHRLYDTDAGYVDVIHTDAGVFGITEVVGHADYFPNSGAQQPECVLESCSHSRAWQLFAESVVAPLSFPALRCTSWTTFKRGQCTDEISYMGYASKPGTRGSFYLQTEGREPYGKGVAGVRYVNNVGLVRNVQEEALGRVPLVRDLPLIG